MGKYQNEDLIEVFEDTRRWCRSEKALREAVEHSLAETKLYSVGEELHYDKSRYAEPMAVSVSTRRTFEAARELHEKLPPMQRSPYLILLRRPIRAAVWRGAAARRRNRCAAARRFIPCWRIRSTGARSMVFTANATTPDIPTFASIRRG